jgi:hypothetical protein
MVEPLCYIYVTISVFRFSSSDSRFFCLFAATGDTQPTAKSFLQPQLTPWIKNSPQSVTETKMTTSNGQNQ